MKKSLFLIVLLLSLVVAGAACKSKSAGAGSPYKSPDGRFSLTLPPGFGEFQSQKMTQATPSGPVELNVLQSQSSRGACIAGYSDFPAASFEGRTPEKMLEDGRDGALKNIKGTLEKQENITIQGRQGLAVYASANSGGQQVYVRFNFILDKPRAYQVGFLAKDRAELDAPDIQAYFDSFHLNEPATSSGTETDSDTNMTSITKTVSDMMDKMPVQPAEPSATSAAPGAPISGGVLNDQARSLPSLLTRQSRRQPKPLAL